MDRGLFISFEGSEGCGKSTQIEELERRFRARDVEVLVTREPGGTVIGEAIRELLQFTPEAKNMTAQTELLLFAASRAQLVRERIRPALEAGRHVIADRFLDSTTVYQGVGRGLKVETVERINAFVVNGCAPDLTILLDMDSGQAHRRAVASTGREGARDRMESQPPAFYEDVRRGYLRLVEKEPERFFVVDATLAIEEIAASIWNALEERFDGIFG